MAGRLPGSRPSTAAATSGGPRPRSPEGGRIKGGQRGGGALPAVASAEGGGGDPSSGSLSPATAAKEPHQPPPEAAQGITRVGSDLAPAPAKPSAKASSSRPASAAAGGGADSPHSPSAHLEPIPELTRPTSASAHRKAQPSGRAQGGPTAAAEATEEGVKGHAAAANLFSPAAGWQILSPAAGGTVPAQASPSDLAAAELAAAHPPESAAAAAMKTEGAGESLKAPPQKQSLPHPPAPPAPPSSLPAVARPATIHGALLALGPDGEFPDPPSLLIAGAAPLPPVEPVLKPQPLVASPVAEDGEPPSPSSATDAAPLLAAELPLSHALASAEHPLSPQPSSKAAGGSSSRPGSAKLPSRPSSARPLVPSLSRKDGEAPAAVVVV